MSLNFGFGSKQSFIPLDSESLKKMNGGESGGGGGGADVDIATPEKCGIVKPDETSIHVADDGTINVKQYAMMLTYEELPNETAEAGSGEDEVIGDGPNLDDLDIGQGGSEDEDLDDDTGFENYADDGSDDI